MEQLFPIVVDPIMNNIFSFPVLGIPLRMGWALLDLIACKISDNFSSSAEISVVYDVNVDADAEF